MQAGALDWAIVTAQAKELLVFAHADEASAFGDVPHLITGVGKVNAATALAAELATAWQQEAPFEQITVLGTAGIVGDAHDLDTVVEVTGAVQHDFSLPSPLLKCGSALTGEPLTGIPTATIATADVFVQDDTQRRHIAELGASLCDMEVYAYLKTAEVFHTPIRVFKVPSDFADSSTTQEQWDDIVALKSQQLRQFYNTHLAA